MMLHNPAQGELMSFLDKARLVFANLPTAAGPPNKLARITLSGRGDCP